MRRFLCAALFAGLIFVSGESHAQRANSNLNWPEVPEISEDPVPSDVPVTRSAPSGWPGTGQPAAFTPPASASSQSAAPSDSSAAQVSETSEETPNRRATRTGPALVPPLPERLSERTTGSSDDSEADETEEVARATPAAEPADTASRQAAVTDGADEASTADTNDAPETTADAASDAAASREDTAAAPPGLTAEPAAQAQRQADPAPKAESTAQPDDSGPAQPAENVSVQPADVAEAERSTGSAPGDVAASEPSEAAPEESAAPEAEPAQNAVANAVEPKPADEAALTEETQPDVIPAIATAADGPAASTPPKAIVASQAEPVRLITAPAESAAKVETTETAPADQAETAPAKPASSEETAPAQMVAARGAEPVKSLAQSAKVDDGLDRIIGQMILVAFAGTDPKEEGPQHAKAQIESGQIGGVLFTGRNVQTVRQLTDLAHGFKDAASEHPPFVAVTHEGGAEQPLSAEKGFSAYPSAGALGSANDPLNAFTVYQRMAEKLSTFGFNVNLGPTIDIQPTTDTGKSPDESHSYGSTPKHVVAFAKAFRLAHQQNGILTVLKHFPSAAPEPDTSDDASAESAETPDPLEAFRQMIASENADLIMTGHLADPRFSDEPGLPASLSEKAVMDRLRGELKFDGVVLSGDLASPELAEELSLKDRVLRAINAGTDMLLVAGDTVPEADLPEKIADIVREAVADGELQRDRLEASYERIATLKRSLANTAKSVAATDGNKAN